MLKFVWVLNLYFILHMHPKDFHDLSQSFHLKPNKKNKKPASQPINTLKYQSMSSSNHSKTSNIFMRLSQSKPC